LRDTRSGGGKRVVVKARHASLNHRQQQIVHTARELVQAPRGSKQHKEAARNLAALNLNQHELALASRAAEQHRKHLDQMHARQAPSLEPTRKGGREVTGILPFVLPGMDPEIHYTEKHPHIGHNADEGDVLLRQQGINDALKKTQISPVLRGVRQATQDVLGPSITAFAQGRHATKLGLAGDVAMLIDPTKVTRGVHAAVEAARAGEGAVDVLRATKTAVSGSKEIQAVAKWKRTKAGKQAVNDLKSSPDRAKIHAQIDTHVDMKPREKQKLKQHFDHQILASSKASGKTPGQILNEVGVDTHLKLSPEEVVANRIRPRDPGREGLAPVGQADPALRAKVATALESHGVDTSVFRKAEIDPNTFADLIARGEPGRFWYEDSGKRILEEAHGNPVIADKIAQLLAVYSAQRAPVENTQLALNAFHEWQRTGRVSSFGTGPQIEKANQILVEGKPWEGLKTDRFYGNLLEEIDPQKYAAMFPGGEVTNDIWMARLFGLKNDNPTTREYHAMTGIVQRIADELGWKPKQVQAALWVAKKAEHEGTSIDQAAIDFSTALRSETAHLPFEAAPGADFAPALYEQYTKLAPEAQRAYTAAKADLVNQFLDETGIFGRLGHEGVGVYEGQFNPSWTVYMPASRGKGPAFDLAVAPHAKEELDSVAAAIGQAFHQDAAAWFKPFYKKSTSVTKRNGAKAILDRAMRPEEAVALDERFSAAGQDIAIIHDHDGVHFMNLDPGTLSNRDFQAAVGAQIDEVFGPETRTLTYASDGNYITKEEYGAHLGGDAGGRSDVLSAAADRLEERGAAIDKQFLAEPGAGADAGGGFRLGGDGLSSGINPGFEDNTEKGLLGDWFAKLRSKDEPAPEAPAVPTEGELAAEKVMKGMKGVPTKQREQKLLQSTERGQRAGLAEEAMAGVKGIEEKLLAAKAELEGALPKLQHDGIRGLNENEIDRVGELIENHPDLRFYERLRAMDALRNAWHGTLPTPSELKLLKRALGPQITREAFMPTRLMKYKHVAYELTNMPRSLMASFDVSAPFRQGLVAFARHPLMTSRNLKPMMKYFASEHGYQDLMRSIDARPNRDLYAKAKLAITDVEHSLEGREEQFMSSYAEKLNIPIGKGHSVGPGHVVRGSGRAYTGFLVKTRADMFDFLVEKAANLGHDITDEKFLKDLGAYVNAATGRGNLGKLEGAAVVLNSTFFSPRLMASRLTFLNPKSYMGLHPFVRQQKLRAAFQLAGAIGAVLWLGQMAGAKVGLDPFNADFGKLKIGDTRFDISGGFAGYTRMLGALGMAMTGHDPDRKAQDTLVRFFRGKLSPLPATGVDVALHTDYSGYRTPNYPTEIRNLFIPLIVQDTMKVVGNQASIGMVAATAGASAIGVGVNTYKASPSSKNGKGKGDTTEKFNSKLEKTMGSVPLEVASAEETKTMYEAAEKRRKDELGVTSMTDEQRTYVKLAVLQAQRPELKQAIDALRQSLDEPNSSEVAKEVDSWAEDELGWKLLSTYQDALR
jgi:hypothetical protein